MDVDDVVPIHAERGVITLSTDNERSHLESHRQSLYMFFVPFDFLEFFRHSPFHGCSKTVSRTLRTT